MIPMIARINSARNIVANEIQSGRDPEELRARLKLPPMIFAIVAQMIELSRQNLTPSRIIIRPAMLIELRAEAQGPFEHYVQPDPDEPLLSRFLNLELTPVANADLPDRAWSVLTRN